MTVSVEVLEALQVKNARAKGWSWQQIAARLGVAQQAAQAQLRCPRLGVAGSADQITYDERWGGVRVDMAGPVISRRAELEALGWEVRVLEGLDHLQAMQAAQVLPILRPWLLSEVATGS